MVLQCPFVFDFTVINLVVFVVFLLGVTEMTLPLWHYQLIKVMEIMLISPPSKLIVFRTEFVYILPIISVLYYVILS